ncbi:MAG: CDP-alcohol phosphatidyltransferase family protein [Phycisphaerae bacterium]|nr:CDP-alcohol phosphatidyltransferase family protein [Phycisphaerae bacterium]
MIGRGIGSGFAAARDFLARGLVRLGVRPNWLTVGGMAITAAAGVCYALGVGRQFAWTLRSGASPNAYLLLGGGLLVLASACDMLDGAVARLGTHSSVFGQFLDSMLDRFSDFAVYSGIAIGYAVQGPANITFVLLSMLSFVNAFMISYAKARAENLIASCPVGYWQRGERSAAILIATFAHNIPALVIQQAMLPLLTVVRRILYTRAVMAGKRPPLDPRAGRWWLKVRLWRWPRMTVPYDLVTGLNIAWLIFAPIPAYDVLRQLAEVVST